VIAGSWNKQGKDVTISHESIYVWLYNEADKDLKKLLPRAKPKRGLFERSQKKAKYQVVLALKKDLRKLKIDRLLATLKLIWYSTREVCRVIH
jgi:IS30 family transposase